MEQKTKNLHNTNGFELLSKSPAPATVDKNDYHFGEKVGTTMTEITPESIVTSSDDPLTAASNFVTNTPSEISNNDNSTQRRVVLETKDLSVGYGKQEILNKINLKFESNSITALVGPSGSGKSSFLRTLNRMNDSVKEYWHSGEVMLDNEEIFDQGIDLISLRRKVGMVFQRPNPFPMSIANNVAIGIKTHKLAGKKNTGALVEKYLTQVGLFKAVSNRLNDSPFKLSGGQQQLLCLARALAIGPEVLLLDEPTSSLDPQTTQAVENLVTEMAKDVTVIIVTHNLAQARRIADYAAFFWDGRLMEYGRAAQVLEDPQNEITAKFVTGKLG